MLDPNWSDERVEKILEDDRLQYDLFVIASRENCSHEGKKYLIPTGDAPRIT